MSLVDASGTRYWVLRTREHWLRCDHEDTAFDAERGVVSLARNPADRKPPEFHCGSDPAALRYGAALDRCDRLWRSVPAGARVERVDADGTIHVLGAGIEAAPGCPPVGLALGEPRGLTIDGAERLYIADATARRVIIVDLETGRQVARLAPPSRAGRTPRPWDLCADPSGKGAYLLDRGTRCVWRLRPDRAPIQLLGPGGEWERSGQESLNDPVAIAMSPDGDAVVVLDRIGAEVWLVWARRADVRRVRLGQGQGESTITDASCFAFDARGHLFVGGDKDSTLVEYELEGTAPDELRLSAHEVDEQKPWSCDGGALLTGKAGELYYTTADGIMEPSPAFPDYARSGRVVSFALDSGIPGCVWHRLFLEACLPEHTSLTVRTRTSDTLDPPIGIDEPPGGFPVRPPQGFAAADMRVVDDAPTYLAGAPDFVPVPRLLHRPAGADRPLYRPELREDTPLDLYEGLVFAPPGRYLWIELTLGGTDRVTPTVRGLRAYYPRPSYLRYLPAIYREDAPAAEFLDRLLSIFEVFHSELDAVRDHLAALFDPTSVPPEALDWLAGWLGLVLDRRWPEERRRKLVASAARLYKRRGTLRGLTDFLRLYLDLPFHIVEGFRTRQSAGVIVGADPSIGASVVGAGLTLNEPGALARDTAAYAHRFTVFVAGLLTDEQRAVVGDIIELEKPAHTLAEVCDITETTKVGQRALVGISTLVGRAPCFENAVVGGEGWPVGRQVILAGDPERRMRVGTINLGRNTVVS
jgi:phage tail-like protein